MNIHNSIIIIDELELHLHPPLQQGLLRNRLMDLRNRFEDNYAKLLADINIILTNTSNALDLIQLNREEIWIDVNFRQPHRIDMNVALMGSGTLQIIEVLLSIYERDTSTNIILLDDPDSHIHRILQKRLLNVLQKAPNTQVFITAHNEAMIRDANANWVFHLENQAKREEPYQAIAANLPTKKGLLQSGKSPIISTLNGGNGLDFVNALEADILFLVEGEDDALRMQQLLSLRNTNKKFAFWILRGVDSIFSQIGLLKDVFSNIKNNKTLWQKAVLLFDKDLMTDVHRQLLMEGFEGKMGIKTHIWQSYCFESVLFSNMPTLLRLLQRFIKSKHSLDANTADLNQYFETALIAQIKEKEERIKEGSLFNAEVGKFQSCRKKLIDKDLKMELKDIIVQDAHLQRTLETYWQNCCTFDRFHEIMNKKDIETVLNTVLQHFNIDFVLDEDNGRNDFDDLFAGIDIITEPNEYNVFSTFIR